MLRKLSLTPAVLLVAFLFSGCAEMMGGGSDAMVKMFTDKLGITNNQAMGGAGSELTLAKEKMSRMDFDALSKAVPGSDTFMKAAKDLGAVTGPIGDKAGLQSAFQRLGMDAGMMDRFTKMFSDYAGKNGGDAVKTALAGMFR